LTTQGTAPPEAADDDESLVARIAAGHEEALALLHRRYAGLVFHLAARSLDRTAAEEIVQDVFLTVWRRAAVFDPARGRFRSWLLQIAHRRILNELRSRSRRPRLEPDPGGELAATLPDPSPEPSEAAWEEYRRAVLRAAVEALPPKQRQALGLAFFHELTHEQVAAALDLRLGTAKTRIRAAILRLREQLTPIAVAIALALGASVATLAVRGLRQDANLAREDRALVVATSSDVVPLHLSPVALDLPAGSHGSYRARAGSETAVLTVTALPSAPAGRSYQAWARFGARWVRLGSLVPDAGGHGRLIAEDPTLAAPPDELQVTLESTRTGAEPRGPALLRWRPE
jgi:RNA polymerase sigma-70 factor (ECF subfamily)